jgi:sucrose-6-phosphate hydrolase SacC (GH32 family)
MDGMLRLHLLLDTSSVEVFAQDGETVLTSLILPSGRERAFELMSGGSPGKVRGVEIWELKPRPQRE